MLDYAETVINAVVTGLTVLICGYVLTKITERNIEKRLVNAKTDLKKALEEWLNSETGKMALYQIGGLIGNGAKQGLGMQNPKGKGGIEGFVLDLIGKYLSGVGQKLTEQPNAPQTW